MRAAAVAVAAALLVAAARPADAKSVTLSNTALPTDTDGNLLLTGEATILAANGLYWVYMNNWGGCPGVDWYVSATWAGAVLPSPCVNRATNGAPPLPLTLPSHA
jgi:hypothetical protein